MATVPFALNNADTTTTISSATDLIQLSDPNNLFTGHYTAFRVGNDLHIDFDGKGEIIVIGQYATATPLVTAIEFVGWTTFNFANLLPGTPGNDFYVGTSIGENISFLDGNNIAFADAGDDTMSGGSGGDEFHGGAGNDSLLGLGGDDDLYGDEGNDTLLGNGGNDTLLGGAGSDFLRGGDGNDSLNGGVITDRINYADGNTVSFDDATGAVTVNLSGITGTGTTGTGTASGAGIGTDTLANFNFFRGSNFNDTITGSTALTLEVFEGLAGNDSIDGGTITDTLNGENNNRVSYQNATAAVNVNLATNSATGTATGTDTLANINQARGSNYNDTLTGSDRTDVTEQFEGRTGDDVIDGAGGFDIARYDNASGAVSVSLATGSSSGADGNDTLSGIEGVRGSKFDDALTGGNAASDALEFFNGMAGNDTIDGGTGFDRVDYQFATGAVTVNLATGKTSGADGIDDLFNIEGVRGSAFNDTLVGSDNASGVETFEGREGNDSINGGGGTDQADYYYAKAGVTVNLATGTASGDASTGTDTLLNIEDVRGSRDFNDSITGSALANTLEGKGGNDSLVGNDGNDELDGGAGNDTLDGGEGFDAMMGGNGNDSLLGGNGDDLLAGDAGSNTLVGGAGFDYADFYFQDGTGTGGVVASLNAGSGTATVSGANGGITTMSGIEGLSGTEFNDTLTGDAGNNYVAGWAGNDSLVGGAGADTMYGGQGNDVINGGVITDKLNGSDFNLLSYWDDYDTPNNDLPVNVNLQTGGATGQGSDSFTNINMVRGSNGNDTITGTGGTGANASLLEQIEGGAGDDTLDGGAITDTLNQENSNRVSYQNAGAGVTVDLSLTSAQNTVGAGTDTLSNFNQVLGSGFNDSLLGSNSTPAEQFEGLAGNDTIDGRGGFDWLRYDRAGAAVTVDLVTGTSSGGAGIDTFSNIEGIRGSAFGDVLTGGNAANGVWVSDGLFEVFQGNAGNDTIDGGQGYDRTDYTNSTAAVTVTLNDTLDGSANDGLGGTDVLRNIEGVRGSSFNDTLTGSNTAAYESFEGREGNDSINGNGGTDRIDYGNSKAGVTVNLATGTASDGYGGTDTLSNIEDVQGSRDFNDSITGSAANNKLEGLAGNDTLLGGAGSDFLRGGDGNDSLNGGVITDRINYADGNTVSFDDATGAVTVNLSGITGTGTTGTGTASGAGIGTDTLANFNFFRGSNFNDTITGSTALTLEVFEGLAGNDSIDGGTITDTLNGENNNRVSYQNATAAVNVNLATNSATGTATGTDTLANINQARGSNYNDTLTGSDRTDVTEQFEGRTGDDVIDGAGGFDIARYDNASGAVSVSLATGSSSGADGNDTLSGIEGVRGSKFDDALTGGNAASDALEFFNGMAGNDTIDGGTGFDRVDYQFATGAVTVNLATGKTSGADGIDDLFNIEGVRGSAFNDTLVGSDNASGVETFEGREGNDSINGGGGTDQADYYYAKAGVTVNLATGTASGDASTGTDTLLNIEDVRGSRDFNDSITGSALANTLEGKGGNDTLNGGAGNDRLNAGTKVGTGSDLVDGGTDTDTLLLAGNFADYNRTRPTATDTLLVNTITGENITVRNVESFEFLDGTKTLSEVWNNAITAFADSWVGTAGPDSVDGLAGNDTLSGLAGNDTLIGGTGNDSLIGGAGDDDYSVDAVGDVVVEAVGEGNDRVEVSFTAAGTYALASGAEIETVRITGALAGVNVTGNNFDNYITGNTGTNILNGLGGDDVLDGNGGADTLVGGVGEDVFVVDSLTDVVTENLHEGDADAVLLRLASAGTYTLTANVEEAYVVVDTIGVNLTGNGEHNVLGGNALANMLAGLAGNDTLVGGRQRHPRRRHRQRQPGRRHRQRHLRRQQ